MNNPRHAEMLPRLDRVTHYKVLFSDYIPLRWIQFRLWSIWSKRVIYPLILPRLRRLHPCLFSTDTNQVRFFDGPVILDVDDPPYPLDEDTIVSCNLPNVAVVVVPTEPIRRQLLSHGVTRPVVIIPQGVSLRDLKPQRVQEIAAHHKRPGEIVVGFAAPGLYLSADGIEGNIRKQMDCLDEFLEIVAQARSEVPELTVWLFGRPSQSLTAYAQRDPWLRLFGHVPHTELLNYVANFDIAVYPRRVDLGGRFSVKLAEFMACGVPVVSTNVSESFVIAEAGGGIVVESPEAFVQALVTLARSPDMRRSLGEAGRRFGQSLDWDMLAVRYQREVLDVYASA
jgi:glycosyltransferase involved in cell wall biosynthesis